MRTTVGFQSPDASGVEYLEFDFLRDSFILILCYEDVHSGDYPVLGFTWAEIFRIIGHYLWACPIKFITRPILSYSFYGFSE